MIFLTGYILDMGSPVLFPFFVSFMVVAKQWANTLSGDYFKDREFRKRFMSWLNALWAEKDKRLAALLNEERSALRRGKA